MSNLKAIRERLGVTQAAMAEALGCSQGNVSFYEAGQTFPPAAAQQLIAYAAGKGLHIGFDHVYGAAPLPELMVRDVPQRDAGRTA